MDYATCRAQNSAFLAMQNTLFHQRVDAGHLNRKYSHECETLVWSRGAQDMRDLSTEQGGNGRTVLDRYAHGFSACTIHHVQLGRGYVRYCIFIHISLSTSKGRRMSPESDPGCTATHGHVCRSPVRHKYALLKREQQNIHAPACLRLERLLIPCKGSDEYLSLICSKN